MCGRFSEDEFLRIIVEEAARPLRLEMGVFKSVDHVVRCFDSALFKLWDMNALNEHSVRLLLNVLGQDFAPYVILMSKYADYIRLQRPRFSLINKYLHVIEEIAEIYREAGVKPPELPLGFNRPSPDVLRHAERSKPHIIDIRWKEPPKKISKTYRTTDLVHESHNEEARPTRRYYEKKSRRSVKKITIPILFLVLFAVFAPYVLPSDLVPSWWPKLLPPSVAGFIRNLSENAFSPPPTGFALMYPSITLKEMNKAGEIVFDGPPPTNKEAAIWKILSWVDTHIRYDYSKASVSVIIYNPESGEIPKYQSPLETIKKGSGICADYAILISTLLVYAGIDSYILVINSSDLRHAAAVAVINDTAFVLEQHPPPIEFQDYYEYMLGSLGFVNDSILYHVIMKNGKLILKEVGIPQSWLHDSYPKDYVPESLSNDVLQAAEILSKGRIIPDPGLKSLITYNYSAFKLSPRIALAGLGYVDTGKFYSPTLKHVYALFYAEYLIEFLNHLNASRIYTYVSFTEGKFIVTYTYTPAPEVKLERHNGYVTLEVHFKEPVKSAAVWYYNPRNDNSVAGVLPRGWHYTDIRTITALQWEYTPTYLRAVWVEPPDLRNVCIGITANGEDVYASCPSKAKT